MLLRVSAVRSYKGQDLVPTAVRRADLTGLEDLSGLWQEMPFLEEMASLGIDLTGLEDLSGLWQEMPFLEEMASLGIDLTGLEDLSGLWPEP